MVFCEMTQQSARHLGNMSACSCLICLFLLEETNHIGRGFWVGGSARGHARDPLWLTIGT